MVELSRTKESLFAKFQTEESLPVLSAAQITPPPLVFQTCPSEQGIANVKFDAFTFPTTSNLLVGASVPIPTLNVLSKV